jgi:hypothetical protein
MKDYAKNDKMQDKLAYQAWMSLAIRAAKSQDSGVCTGWASTYAAKT